MVSVKDPAYYIFEYWEWFKETDILSMGFLNWFWGFLDLLSNLIRLKKDIDSVSSSKEKTDSLQYVQFIERPKIPLLDTSSQPLTRGKEMVILYILLSYMFDKVKI